MFKKPTKPSGKPHVVLLEYLQRFSVTEFTNLYHSDRGSELDEGNYVPIILFTKPLHPIKIN